MKQKEYYQFLQLAIPLFSYLALVQIWEQYNYIQMRNYYTLVHIMLSCEVMYINRYIYELSLIHI